MEKSASSLALMCVLRVKVPAPDSRLVSKCQAYSLPGSWPAEMMFQHRPVTGTAGRLPACALEGWKLLNKVWKGEERKGNRSWLLEEVLRPRAPGLATRGCKVKATWWGAWTTTLSCSLTALSPLELPLFPLAPLNCPLKKCLNV